MNSQEFFGENMTKIIGLHNLEPQIENTALMQVSQFHKQKGDIVKIYKPNAPKYYDKVYAFSLFNFTDKSKILPGMICGGTGFDILSKLPNEIEQCDYDYSMYPYSDKSYIWFSRGCIRKCPYCVVYNKEGDIHQVKPKRLNPNGKYIMVVDNNFFANKYWPYAIKQLQRWNQPVNFSSGIDLRIFDSYQGRALQSIKLTKYIHIAWDNPKDNLIPKIQELLKYLKAYKIVCYVLIGYWSTPDEDLMRVIKLKELGVEPFVMPYNKKDYYQKNFARWVNHKAVFKTTTWDQYDKSKR